MLREMKLLRDEIASNHPTTLSTPEGQWISSFSNSDLDQIEAFIPLSSFTWTDGGRPNLKPNYFFSLWSSYVPIDQSIGYVNSNPFLTLLMHESNQAISITSMEDTHVSHKQEKLWNALNSAPYNTQEINTALNNILTAGFPWLNSSSNGIEDVIAILFQFQPLLAMFYLKDYAPKFGI